MISTAMAPHARALPSIPNCPGNGNDSVAIGADGGWCNFMYMPDGTHVSCRWADFSFLIGDIGGHSECRRVDQNGNLLPGSPPWGLMKDWGGNEGSGGAGTPPQPEPVPDPQLAPQAP
jgi:hypothetical protein